MERLVHGKGPTLQLIVLQADTISYIDATSRETIKALVNQWHQKGWKTSISGAIGPVRDALAKDGLLMADQLSFQISVDHAVQQFNQPGSVPDAAKHLAQQHSSSTS
jgi:MFS superfamily sulfate permease-like transporter